MSSRFRVKMLHVYAEQLQNVMSVRTTFPHCGGLYNQQVDLLYKMNKEFFLMNQELKRLGANVPHFAEPLPPRPAPKPLD